MSYIRISQGYSPTPLTKHAGRHDSPHAGGTDAKHVGGTDAKHAAHGVLAGLGPQTKVGSFITKRV